MAMFTSCTSLTKSTIQKQILYFWVLDLLYTLSHAKERTKTHEHVTPAINILGMYLHPTALVCYPKSSITLMYSYDLNSALEGLVYVR
jgi:hypothetical protein